MTNKEYRDHIGLSRSQLSQLSKSPLHFKYAMEHREEKDSAALLFGRAAHKYILEKEDFFNEFVIAPNIDRRTKAGREEYAEFLKIASGKDVLSIDDFDIIQAMSDAIDAYPLARKLLTGECEQSYFWVDPETKTNLKCRPDCLTEWMGKKYIVDYKTTDSCEDGHFERSCKKYGYKLQAGMYREGMFQNALDDYGFIFVAQEKKAPYAVRIFKCSPAFIDEGYDQYRALVGLYHYCEENNKWFGYEGPENEIDVLQGEDE